jgi:protein involved in polysaccharide export with SLBB domain
MKKVLLLFALTLAVASSATAQNQTRERRSGDSRSVSSESAVRTRVVTPVKNHSDKQSEPTSSSPKPNRDVKSTIMPSTTVERPAWGNTAILNQSIPRESTAPRNQAPTDITQASVQSTPRSKLVQPTAMISEAPSVRLMPPATNASVRLSSRGPATILYRVGVGDVLDIRLTNMPTRESTLFTVLKSGIVEYPLLSGAVRVDGMTTDEIAALLSKEIKVIDHPQVAVSVRDYASHTVIVSGAVDSPGRKILRRESMPLYALLAEALPRPEAGVVTLTRDSKSQTLSMASEQQMSTPTVSGDLIRVSAAASTAKRFLYVGGDVASAGEKEFREGMTLTQALLTAGGADRGTKLNARVARRNASGFLVTSEYNISAIRDGKAPDPILEAGDRIEVIRGM